MASIRRLPSGLWQASVRLPSGRRITYSDRLKGVVAAWAAEREDELRAGVVRDPRAGRVSVGEWHERWLAARVVADTTARKDAGNAARHVLPHWRDWPVAAVTTMDVQGWVRRLSDGGLGAPSVHQAFFLLSSMMDAAVASGVLVANPCRGVTLPTIARRAPRFFTHAETDAILAATAEVQAEPRAQWPVMVELDLWTGLRWGELAALRRAEVDVLRGRLFVVRVATPKGVRDYPKSRKSYREVPVPPDVLERLNPLLVGLDRDELVFTNHTRTRPVPHPTFWSQVWVPALSAAKVPYAPPHTLRHTAASWLVMAGVDLYRVQALLGHESFATTQRYAHLAPAAHAAVLDAWSKIKTHQERTKAPGEGSAGS